MVVDEEHLIGVVWEDQREVDLLDNLGWAVLHNSESEAVVNRWEGLLKSPLESAEVLIAVEHHIGEQVFDVCVEEVLPADYHFELRGCFFIDDKWSGRCADLR